jgi:hypothetical protein
MTKSIRDNQKKERRGRPKTTGTTPMTGVRLSAELETAIANWSARQSDKPNKAEAIRRLVEAGLASAPPPHGEKSARTPRASVSPVAKMVEAAGLAAQTIDCLGDTSATSEERESRKRRLIKGPSEFRQMRRNRSKPKGQK